MARRKARPAPDTPAERAPMITPERAKRLIKLAKVVGPTVVPLVAPYALRAAGTVREGVDRMRARRLGVPPDELTRYTGHGARLHARIASLAQAMAELAERQPEAGEFAESSRATLTKLAAAVRAAEQMPGSRRRAAHRAVAAELDRIDGELLRRLGI
jgi:ABC-type transporter Mla subunit MlaD